MLKQDTEIQATKEEPSVENAPHEKDEDTPLDKYFETQGAS